MPARTSPGGQTSRWSAPAAVLDQRRLQGGELGGIRVRQHEVLLRAHAVLERILRRARLAFFCLRPARLRAVLAAGLSARTRHGGFLAGGAWLGWQRRPERRSEKAAGWSMVGILSRRGLPGRPSCQPFVNLNTLASFVCQGRNPLPARAEDMARWAEDGPSLALTFQGWPISSGGHGEIGRHCVQTRDGNTLIPQSSTNCIILAALIHHDVAGRPSTWRAGEKVPDTFWPRACRPAPRRQEDPGCDLAPNAYCNRHQPPMHLIR